MLVMTPSMLVVVRLIFPFSSGETLLTDVTGLLEVNAIVPLSFGNV